MKYLVSWKKIISICIIAGCIIASYVVYTQFSARTIKFSVSFSPKWVNQAQFAGVFVAKEKGFYAKKGLDVSVNEFQLGGSVMNDLRSGKSQIGLMSANEFLNFYSKGEKIKAVAAFYQVSPFLIASKKSLGIESPIQLKDKRLGIKGGPGGEGELVYDLLLKSAGVSMPDVALTYIPFGSSEADDLIAGRVDVIGFYRTQMSDFQNKGVTFNFIYPEKFGAALYNDVLVVNADFLATHPEVVKSFLHQTINGWQYAFDHAEEALALTLRYVTDQQFKDIDLEREILRESKLLIMPQNKKSEIGNMDVERWQRFYDALRSRGILQKEFNVQDALVNNLLP